MEVTEMPIINGYEVLNTEREDYHAHTITFSDGLATLEEMVVQAGKIGMTRLVLTDHSQAALDADGLVKKTHRSILRRWKNVHNEVEVFFGVEGDILNPQGDVCFDIQGIEPKHIILSGHDVVFSGDKSKITEAYLNAIKRYGSKVMFIGHLCSKYFEKEIDVVPIIELALAMDIPFELNGGNLANGKTNMDNLHKMLARAKKLYINSDAHTLNELTHNRHVGFQFLQNYTRRS